MHRVSQAELCLQQKRAPDAFEHLLTKLGLAFLDTAQHLEAVGCQTQPSIQA